MIRSKCWVRQLTSAALCLCLLFGLCTPAQGYAAQSANDTQEESVEPAPAETSGQTAEDTPEGAADEAPVESAEEASEGSAEEAPVGTDGEAQEENAEAALGESAQEQQPDAEALARFLSDPTADPIPDGAVAISDEAGLRAIGSSGDYYLTADIALTQEWTPIPSFSGTLDGRGHQIKLLQIQTDTENAGLFAIATGTIRNLGITLSRNGVTGAGSAGALAGRGGSGLQVVNCYVIPNNPATVPTVKSNAAGGLVGNGNGGGLLENCYSTVAVEGSCYVGGLVGSFEGTVTNCHAEGDVSWAATGTQTSTGVYGGGLIGNASGQGTVLDRCSAKGSVTLQGTATYYYAGGLIGLAEGEITRCSATGNVVAGVTSTTYGSSVNAGGLVGFGRSSHLSDCFAAGDVAAPDAETCNVGGLLGGHGVSGVFLNCYATGNLTAYRGTIGTLSGSEDIRVYQCYFPDTQTRTFIANGSDTPKNLLDQGESLTVEQFRNQESFSGWDFYKCWKLESDQNGGYPALREPGEELENPADRPDEPETPQWVDGFLSDPTADSIDGFQPITSAEDLAAIAGSGSYYLANDIVLEKKWEPITNFYGVLDGRGHCVSNLYVDVSNTYQCYAGLFGSLSGAEIRNLAVSVAEIRTEAQMPESGGGYTAAAGGIAGNASNTKLVNCYVLGGPVSARGTEIYAGGLLGQASSGTSLTMCYAEIPIAITQEDLNAQTVSCYAGGLVGSESCKPLSRCFATGDVSVTILNELGSNRISAGGLAGTSFGTVEDCYALGSVTVASISDSGPGYTDAGGFSASAQSVARCYAAGDVRVTQNDGSGGYSTAGPLICNSNASATDCYYALNQVVEVPGTNYAANVGKGLSEAEQKTQSAYEGWTFGEGGWKLEAELNGGLPCLSGYRPATGSRAGYAGFLQDPVSESLPEDAIPISSVAELKNIGTLGTGNSNPYFYLTRDLYLEEEWAVNISLGKNTTLDGRGRHITNLHTNQKSYGLFKSTNGTVKNLAIHVGASGFTGGSDEPSTGALSANAGFGTNIINCFVTGGKVSSKFVPSGLALGSRVGGLVGNTNYSNSNGTVTISYCYTTVMVEGSAAGGLVGRDGHYNETYGGSYNAYLLIDHCYTEGTVRGVSAGGLVGYILPDKTTDQASAVRNSYSTAKVSTGGSASVRDTPAFGGLIGLCSDSIILQNCYAAGTVSCSDAAGNLVGSGSTVVVLNCFSPDTQGVTGQSVSTQGKVLTQPAMQQKSSYTGWDFSGVWQLVPEWNGGYPTLRGYLPIAYAPAPTITPSHPAGEYSNVFSLTLRHNGGDGFRLYVSRDNGEYQLYTGPLDIYKSVDLSVQARWQDDPVTTSSFRYTLPDLALTASPQGGTYTLPQEVTLSCNIPDYSIAYALDGGDPVPYTGPIPIQQSARLTAYAQYKGETVGEKTFDYTLNLPELTASPDGGTMARPTDVTLTCSQSDFQILYTLDGSDPREGGSTYSAPIHLDHPVQLWAVSVTTVDGERRYGAEKQWQYDFEDLFSVKDLAVSSRSDGFALTATLDNRYPDSREAFLLAAGYDAAGRLTETKIFPAVSAKDSTAELSGLFTPSKDLNSFRVFALERDSWQPLATPVLNARVFTGLSVSPSSVNGKQGTSQAVTVTARYSDGTSQSLNSGAYTASSSNSSVAYASGGYVYFGSGGSAVITFSYTDGGITKTAQVQAVSEAPTLTGITCSSSSLSGTVGGSQSLSVTAWYADGTSRSLNSGAYTVSSSNSSVAYASGGTIYYAGAGSATLTVSCTEGGVTRTTSVSVTVRESTAAASRRLVSFLLTQPDNRIQITAHASDGSVGVVTILYNTSSGYVHFQYDVVLIDGGGGFAGFDLNPATGSLVQQPVVGFMASNNSTLLWGGHTTNFNAATYYHDSTTLSFTRVTGTVATSTIQSMANTLIQTLVPGAQRMLTENNTGVTLGQLGFLRYA